MSIAKDYPDYMTLSIMHMIRTKPDTTYNDLLKHTRLPKLAVKSILQQLLMRI